MTPPSPPLRQLARFCGDCLALIACWTVWLALGALLALQIAIAVSHEVALPRWMLRSLEARFAAANVHARFGRTTFNTTGGVLLENLAFSLPEFEQPVVRARAVYLELDPWLLLAGQVEPRRIHATGLQLLVPGMLTPSGHDEQRVQDLEFTVSPDDTTLLLENLTVRVAGVPLAVHGAVQLPRSRAPGAVPPLPLLARFTTHFAAFCQQLERATQQLPALDDPQLDLDLVSSTTHGAIAHLTLTARKLALPQFHAAAVRELRLTARFPLLGDGPALSPLAIDAGEIDAGSLANLRRVHAEIRGAFTPAKLSFAARQLELTAGAVSARGFSVESIVARAEPRPLPQLYAQLVAFLKDVPIAADLNADLSAQTATVHFQGGAAPALLDPIAALIGHDVRRFFDFTAPIDLDVVARFAAGWKFKNLAGHASLGHVDAYRVPIDSAHGEIEFDGRHFLARHAFARLGENFARGSFEQDLKTKDFRFLLEGRLRPLEIGGWFHGEWWRDIFSYFEFPDTPPPASVDVTGRWFSAPETAVFVFVDTPNPVIRGAHFDFARTRLFIRPNYFVGLEAFGTRGGGEVHGTFARSLAPDGRGWSKFVFAGSASIDLDTGARLLGPALATQLAPFAFAQPPHVKLTGDFDGPGAPSGPHQNLTIAARTTGDFSFYRFPAQNLSFDATLRDSELTVENIRAEAAGGTVAGHARVWGPPEARRLGFDGAVRDADLHRAVTTVTEYAAIRQGRPAAASEKILSGKNTARLDLALSAEGRLDDPFSFVGSGNASLVGELGQVRLLGLLSELLNFTALRFTNARTDFKIQGTKITFPSLNVTGANSAIAAHGNYFLDRHELDFNARVYPFQESKGLLQSVVGAVLTPFSAVLEVKLTGALDQPKWAFVIGPTNLFRSLSEGSPSPATADASTPAAPAGPPADPAKSKETH